MSFDDSGHVADILDAVLAKVSADLATAGRPIKDGRIVKFSGIPSWDCEMLAVWPRTRAGGFGTASKSGIQTATFKQVLDVNLVLLRCVTALDDGGVPATAVVDGDGEGFAIDMWVTQLALTRGVRDGTLLPDISCAEVKVNAIQPQTPQGGLSGMTTTIEVTLQ